MRTKRGRHARWRWLLQSVAMLLLAVIAVEVTGDADCDPPPLDVRSGAVAVEAGADADGDPCGEFCIPDCFCCSRSVPAGSAEVPPAPVPLSPLAAVDPDDRAEGVQRLVDRPPRA